MVQRLFLLLLTEPITSPLLTYNITTGTFLPSLYTRPRSLASPDTADLSQISMYSAVESNRPRPTVQHHLGERPIHDMISDHIMKPEAGVLGEAQIGPPNDDVGTSDAELEARLKCLEQPRSVYGVSSPHRSPSLGQLPQSIVFSQLNIPLISRDTSRAPEMASTIIGRGISLISICAQGYSQPGSIEAYYLTGLNTHGQVLA